MELIGSKSYFVVVLVTLLRYTYGGGGGGGGGEVVVVDYSLISTNLAISSKYENTCPFLRGICCSKNTELRMHL